MSSGSRTRSVIRPLRTRVRRHVWVAVLVAAGAVNTVALTLAVALGAGFVENFGQVSTDRKSVV